MAEVADITPDDGEVLQEEPSLVTVPVRVDGPVRVQALPARGMGGRRYTVSDTAPLRVLPADPRRQSATLLCRNTEGTEFYVATTSGECGSGFCEIWLARIPYEVTHGDEVWVRAVTAASTVDVSVHSVQWAD